MCAEMDRVDSEFEVARIQSVSGTRIKSNSLPMGKFDLELAVVYKRKGQAVRRSELINILGCL